MPRLKNQEPWSIAFREQVRQLARGWTVRESPKSGRVMLKVRGDVEQAITLPFAWAKGEAGDAYTRIRNIYALTGEGHSLAAAVELAAGKAPNTTIDWAAAVSRFHQQKTHHGSTIKPITWSRSYAPVLADAVALLTSRKPPKSSADLMDACIRKWDPGSRARQIRAQSLAQFLNYCVNREAFPAAWLPPASLRDHIGIKRAAATSQGGDAVEDHQLLELIDSLSTSATGLRWADALRLLAELGLRPIELLHLEVRSDPITREPHWWCSYEKRSGGGRTAPRRVHPLPLRDRDGVVKEWNLLQRWRGGLIELPPLGGNCVGEAFNTYLKRQHAWTALKAQLAAEGQRLVPYSFRHSYSLRGHRLGIPTGAIADSMGHSIEVHCRSYAWASATSTAEAFARAQQRARSV